MLQRAVPDNTTAVGYGCLELLLDTLEKAVTPGPYLLGERFSAADIYIGHQIGFGVMPKAFEARPTLQSYFSRVTGRPAFQRAMQLSEEHVARMKIA